MSIKHIVCIYFSPRRLKTIIFIPSCLPCKHFIVKFCFISISVVIWNLSPCDEKSATVVIIAYVNVQVFIHLCSFSPLRFEFVFIFRFYAFCAHLILNFIRFNHCSWIQFKVEIFRTIHNSSTVFFCFAQLLNHGKT